MNSSLLLVDVQTTSFSAGDRAASAVSQSLRPSLHFYLSPAQLSRNSIKRDQRPLSLISSETRNRCLLDSCTAHERKTASLNPERRMTLVTKCGQARREGGEGGGVFPALRRLGGPAIAQKILKRLFQMAFLPHICIKSIFGRGYAPDPAGGAYDAPNP